MKNLIAAFFLIGATSFVGASDDKPSIESKTSHDKKVVQYAERYKVPEQDVRDLRAKGLGWGEVDHALAIAQKAGKPVAEIMKMRESGMGWGKIAQEHGFKLGDLKGHRHAHAERADRADKADRVDRPHKADHAPKGEHGPKGHGKH